jgi:NADPH:quinone reductase-like Zn-dependent oxidoreductase
MSNSLLIFKDLQFRGFWINAWYKRADTSEIHEMFDQLIPLMASGKLTVPVERTYPLTDVKEALVHACQNSRKGKVLFVMN